MKFLPPPKRSLRDAFSAIASAQELYWARLSLAHLRRRLPEKVVTVLIAILNAKATAFGVADPRAYPWTSLTHEPGYNAIPPPCSPLPPEGEEVLAA